MLCYLPSSWQEGVLCSLSENRSCLPPPQQSAVTGRVEAGKRKEEVTLIRNYSGKQRSSPDYPPVRESLNPSRMHASIVSQYQLMSNWRLNWQSRCQKPDVCDWLIQAGLSVDTFLQQQPSIYIEVVKVRDAGGLDSYDMLSAG